MDQELKPCPFCGCPPKVIEDDSYGSCEVLCVSCQLEPVAHFPKAMLAEALALWNRRPVEARAVTIELLADRICDAGSAWISEPLHRMAYEDMARAVVAEFLPHETDK